MAKQGLYLKAWFLKDGVTLSGIELIKQESEWLSALQVSQVMAGVEGSMFERRPKVSSSLLWLDWHRILYTESRHDKDLLVKNIEDKPKAVHLTISRLQPY